MFVGEELATADRHLLCIGVRERYSRARRVLLLLHRPDMCLRRIKSRTCLIVGLRGHFAFPVERLLALEVQLRVFQVCFRFVLLRLCSGQVRFGLTDLAVRLKLLVFQRSLSFADGVQQALLAVSVVGLVSSELLRRDHCQ